MDRIMFFALVVLALLLAACAPSSASPAATDSAAPPADEEPTAAPEATLQPASASIRTATFSEIAGAVEADVTLDSQFQPANLGMAVPVGGRVRTGEDGKARLDLAPDGTIIRVVPNSSFTLTELAGGEGNPSSKIELFFGKIFILLKGGEMKVETPSGLAAVRGSLLGISYDPATNSITATCLEGHCTLGNAEGILELEGGQAADIINGDLADEARFMTEEELNEWLEEIPEVDEFIEELPDIPDEGGDESSSGVAPSDGGGDSGSE